MKILTFDEIDMILNNVEPHDIEMTIKYHGGSSQKINISWETISDFKKYHDASVVHECYEVGLLNKGKSFDN